VPLKVPVRNLGELRGTMACTQNVPEIRDKLGTQLVMVMMNQFEG
jgi:hypothetical protein